MTAFCFFLLARIGVKPLFLILASISVGVSLGPWPGGSSANQFATALLADSLFSWSVLASLLLIPYEYRTSNDSLRHAALRGALWGLVLSLGMMTKISFLYFVVLILPILLVIRHRHCGFRSLSTALAGFFLTSFPAIAYLIRYGRSSFENGGASSFGAVAGLYKTPLTRYIEQNLHDSPGLWCFVLFSIGAVAWLAIRRGPSPTKLDLLPLLIAAGFGLIVVGSVNRQLRYAFPVIVSVPFLLAVALSRTGNPLPRRFATLLVGPLALVLIAAALPSRSRPKREDSLGRADAVLAQATRCGDKSILMATDSPTLNSDLLLIASKVSDRADSVQVQGLIWNASLGLPLSQDLRTMQGSDLVVFQDDHALNPPFTNLRVPRYRSYISQQPHFFPIRAWDDVWVFSKHCK